MKNDEAKRHLEAARLMLLRPDGQPVSELYDALTVAIEALDAAPAHGEWKESSIPVAKGLLACSNCNNCFIAPEMLSGMDGELKWKYCPNCGARMNGKEKDE